MGKLFIGACLLCAWTSVEAAHVVPPERFFPFGVYVEGNAPIASMQESGASVEEQIEATCADLQAHHFNALWVHNLSPKYLDAWLAAASKHGQRIITQGGDMPMYLLDKGRWENSWKPAIESRVKPFYRELAKKYRGDPTLLAYCLVEEIPPSSPFFPAIVEITQEVQKLDPDHPVIVLHNPIKSAQRAASEINSRILAFDIYPFFAGSSGPTTWPKQRIYYEGTLSKLSTIARQSGVPLWMMVQSWSKRRIDEKGETTQWLMAKPSPAQLRYQVWMALLHGAKGVFFFGYQGSTELKKGALSEHFRDRHGRPLDHYEEASALSRRLDPIKPLLLRLDLAPESGQVSRADHPDIHGRTFIDRDSGSRYLMVVSTDLKDSRPIQLDLGASGPDDRFYDLETRAPQTAVELASLMLEPGGGKMFFIGNAQSWRQHVEWSEKTAVR